MSFRLRNYSANPPGNFPYEQTGDKPHRFRAEPIITATAQQVASYRAANGLPRASFHEALIDVDRYTCARLGNNPRFCLKCDDESTNVALGQTSPHLNPGCSTCGAKV